MPLEERNFFSFRAEPIENEIGTQESTQERIKVVSLPKNGGKSTGLSRHSSPL